MVHKKARKNKKQKTEQSYDASYDGEENTADFTAEFENGVIPNGFTISFDDFDGEEDGDDEDPGQPDQQAPRGGYGSQVLPFAYSLPADHAGIPEDGHEYLYLVRREAATHPGIMTAEAFLRREVDVTLAISDEPIASTSTAAMIPHRPDYEWRATFVSKFRNMRQVFLNSSHETTEGDIPSHYLPIPAAADGSSWKSYINGRKTKRPQSPSKGKAKEEAAVNDETSMETESAQEHGQVAQPDKSNKDLSEDAVEPVVQESTPSSQLAGPPQPQTPRSPIPVLLRVLDHQTCISLLEHFNDWLVERLDASISASRPSTVFLPPSMRQRKKGDASKRSASLTPAPVTVVVAKPLPPLVLTPLDSQWLFSLLSILESLLSSSEISVLRSLARTCQQIADFTWSEQTKLAGKGTPENALEHYTESIAGCWMVNAAIWEVWGQRDLWED